MNRHLQLLYTFTIIGILILSNSSVFAQECPINIENCKGQCGRLIDTDGDGYCDYTVITKIFDTVCVSNGNTEIKQNGTDQSYQSDINSGTEVKTSENSEINLNRTQSNLFLKRALSVAKVEKNSQKHSYRFILWTLITFGAYFISIILHKTKVYSKRTHRRTWNILLLITFLISGILGLVLVIQINYKVFFDSFFTFLKWHVDFGIVMAWIAIFHIIWHFRYFKNIFKGKNKSSSEC